ncbi:MULTISPECIES: HU family DNA-binding protein [Clostridia]|uniref:HU family DNA-binding protein n=1 Tax=Clostridia TaxID=186801 RepID=UPI0015F882CB|nr:MULTISPECIES: HU family DNA-binding protein [Clostridia]
MNRRELIADMASRSGMTEDQTRKCLEAMIDTITLQLKKGEKVQIVGFGTLETVKRESRMTRNPQNGILMSVPDRYVPRFKPRKMLKDTINDQDQGIDRISELKNGS